MKWTSYIICSILILLGIYTGVLFMQDVSSISYINGEISITNRFSMDSFMYSSSGVVFSPTENEEAYVYEIDLLKTEGFDSQRKQYKVELNKYILKDTTMSAGAISSSVKMDFYDTNGDVICEGQMNIIIRFLNSKTQLRMSCPDETSAIFFEQHFIDNGLLLRVIEILE